MRWSISARDGIGIDALRRALRDAVDTEALYHGDTVVSTARHYDALASARAALDRALAALCAGRPADLLSEELRHVLHHLGTITGDHHGRDPQQHLLEVLHRKVT